MVTQHAIVDPPPCMLCACSVFQTCEEGWSSLSSNRPCPLHYKGLTDMWLALLHLVEDRKEELGLCDGRGGRAQEVVRDQKVLHPLILEPQISCRSRHTPSWSPRTSAKDEHQSRANN